MKKNQTNLVSRRKFLGSLSILGVSYFILPRYSRADAPSGDADVVDIAPVWAGHPVNFVLLTKDNQQFVAYYDDQRQMTLALRTLGDKTWAFKKLPTTIGWDTHNYIVMAFDPTGCLHVSGNMHAVPLVYFRGSKPLDIDSVTAVPSMTGQNENSVTYPRFFNGPSGDLLFSYRDGSSGNGNNYFNIYNPTSQTWSRLIDVPLMEGKDDSGSGQHMNAYMQGPKTGPDGYYHVSWVWRNTPDASTCHDLSYMRSKDMVHWETVDGQPLTLPITGTTQGVVVDPIPVNGGILNTMGQIGFDANKQPIISYTKYDANGKTQLYLARYENGAWQLHLASDWNVRYEFSGGGTFAPPIGVAPVELRGDKMCIQIVDKELGNDFWEIDPQTMKLVGRMPTSSQNKVWWQFSKVESTFPGMRVKWLSDTGQAADGKTYKLRWETLPENRDLPRPEPWPPPSTLRVIGVSAA
ncbi:MAG: BNR repeat-containing protein [Methylacidiphilales bacterium]|nr:BNR repeat-containing protein [Candidatus Methylacidiphilales bacterium]